MNNLLATINQLCPHCGRPLRWRVNRLNTVTYNAWCPGCVKLLYTDLPTTERPLLPTEALILARSTPKLPEELEVEAIIQEWRGRWTECPPEADIKALLKYVPTLWWTWDSGKGAWDLWYRSPWDSKNTRVWLGQVTDCGWATENQQGEELNEGTARRALIKVLPPALRPLAPPFPTRRLKPF